MVIKCMLIYGLFIGIGYGDEITLTADDVIGGITSTLVAFGIVGTAMFLIYKIKSNPNCSKTEILIAICVIWIVAAFIYSIAMGRFQ